MLDWHAAGDALFSASSWDELFARMTALRAAMEAGDAPTRLYILRLNLRHVGWGNTALDIATHMLIAVMCRRVFLLDARTYHFALGDYLDPPAYDWRVPRGWRIGGHCRSAVDVTELSFDAMPVLAGHDCWLFDNVENRFFVDARAMVRTREYARVAQLAGGGEVQFRLVIGRLIAAQLRPGTTVARELRGRLGAAASPKVAQN